MKRVNRKPSAKARAETKQAAKRAFHVVVDLPWDASAAMGTGAYSETVVRSMARVAPEARFTLIVAKDAPRSIDLPNIRYETLPDLQFREEGARQIALPSFLSAVKADCLFAPATLLPLVRVCPMVATVHDLVYLRHPEYYAPALITHLNRWLDPSLRAADHLIAISESAKNDLLELRGVPADRITVVQQPVREIFNQRMKDSDAKERLRAMGIGSAFFFHVSNLSPHKNVKFAMEVFADFVGANPQSSRLFVFAGGGVAPNRPPDLEALARKLRISERVRYVGRVSDEQLKALYQGCEAFLFPSLSEGWGLPVAEASRLGARVLASPYVPSAGEGQRLNLDRALWVKTLGDPKAGRPALVPVHFEEAGRKLLEVLRRVTQQPARPMESVHKASRATGPKEPLAPSKRQSGISGCTIIRNGVKLRYPFEESVASYASICEEIVISWDPTSEDDTASLVRRIAARFPNVRLVESVWDMQNRREGTELARQTQIAFGHCRREWTLYVQADEALHERHHNLLKARVSDSGVGGVAFRRSSYFGTLDREIPDHRASGMVRLFRTGYGRSIGDAMHVQLENQAGSILESEAELYNYSRLGSSEDIITRCSNLHRFYHGERWLQSRDPEVELDVKTAPYEGSHPAPIEASFRRRARGTSHGSDPRISVHVIAQEQDAFGADLIASCLDSLEGYADQIVIVDNGLGPEALEAVLGRRKRLPVTLIDGREVTGNFAELRNRALASTAPGMTHIHKVDTDEVYLPGSLKELKDLLHDPSIDQVNATLVHFMIEPTLVHSVQGKDVVFRRGKSLSWQGSVHERIEGLPGNRVVEGPACFLHFGYVRPQWQTLLKWLRYALLQGGALSHYQYEFLDGVRRPWFRDGRTPDTVLEPRREHLKAYSGLYPTSVRPWLENFGSSGRPWREWVNLRVGGTLWKEWETLRKERGDWEATLEQMLSRAAHSAEASHAPSRAVVTPSGSRSSVLLSPSSPVETTSLRRRRKEFREGFSIIIPTWNNLAYLQKAIQSIRGYSTYEHEIVIHVNDGSDGTLNWVKQCGLKYTHTAENVGICIAVNQVADFCTRDLVMYFNDDMVALPEWDHHITEYAETHDLDKLAWLSSTLIEPTGANADFIAPADYGTDMDRFQEDLLFSDLPSLRTKKPDAYGVAWAPNLMYRETFDRIGRLSEEFSPGFGSDPDLARKLWDLGSRTFVIVGKSLVYHFQCKGTGKIPKHLHNDAQGTFLRKHGMSIQDSAGELKRDSRPPGPVSSAPLLQGQRLRSPSPLVKAHK